MMVSADSRTTAVVRRLHNGDKFHDVDGTWKVIGEPVVVDGKEVHLTLQAMNDTGKRAIPGSEPEVFMFEMDTRVNIVR